MPNPLRKWVDKRVARALKRAREAPKTHSAKCLARSMRLVVRSRKLKKQLDSQRQLALVQARLARLETDSGTITTTRPTSNGAHHHDADDIDNLRRDLAALRGEVEPCALRLPAQVAGPSRAGTSEALLVYRREPVLRWLHHDCRADCSEKKAPRHARDSIT